MKSNIKKGYTTVGLIWAACGILLFFAYMLILQPQRQSKKDMAKQLIECELAYKAAVKAAEEETQTRLSSQIMSLQARLANFVVDFTESANLTFDISEIAGRQDIEAFDIKGQEKRSTSDMPTFDYIDEDYFEVGFDAGFNQFAAFVNALEKHEPILFIDKVTITRSEHFDQGHQVNLNLAVLVKKQRDS